MKKQEKEFWVSNISSMDVSLSDLNLTIRARSIVNLLGKNYNYTEEQLNNSLTKGSLFKKRDKLVKRLIPPVKEKKQIVQEYTVYPSARKNAVDLDYSQYEELNISDTDFAQENADLAEIDHLGKYNEGKNV